MKQGILREPDGRERPFAIAEETVGNVTRLTPGEEIDYAHVAWLDFDTGLSAARAGDDGYYLLVQGSDEIRDCGLCYFRDRADAERVTPALAMALFGAKTPAGTYAAVATGLTYQVSRVLRVKDGAYRCFPRFVFNGRAPEEKPEITVTRLPDGADFADMARVYRAFRLAQGFRTLKERLTPQIAYAAESVYVRVRLAWKPVPSPVPEQTLENEPPLHVATTFAEVEAIMDDYRAAGIAKAEFCLVGFNVRGHDGRWPQIFPVEPALGGEDGLRHLLAHAKTLGYTVSCHTNSVDSYRIADCFSEEDLIVEENGEIYRSETGVWSGGRPYKLCPACAARQADTFLPPLAAFGFTGLHYIDVITAVPARACYHPAHPQTKGQGAASWQKVMSGARDLFGGISSESAYDEAMRDCDFILYTSFATKTSTFDGFLDRREPIWQMVYHGITMSCPYCASVNAIISGDVDNLLKVIEYGGRPVIYYDSRFVTETTGRRNWMGDADFRYGSPEAHAPLAARAKEYADLYAPLAYLQYETMEGHAEVAPGVFRTTYGDGSTVTVDYNTKTWELKKPD